MSARVNVVFVVMVAVFVVGGMCGRLFVVLSDDVSVSKWNYFEGRSYAILPEVTPETIVSGEFQAAAEKCISEKIPMRQEVLLAKANVERWFIEAANVPIGYPAYPTFYGSQYVDCRGVKAVYQLPLRQAEYGEEYFSRVSSWIDGLVESAPEAKWVLALPDRSNVSSVVPAADLVADHSNWGYITNGLCENTKSDVRVLDLNYDNLSDYQRAFFRNDHHWQIQGSLEAYRQIVTLAEEEPALIGAPEITAMDAFYGSCCRVGLCPDASDCLYDVSLPDAHLTVTTDGKKADASALGGVEVRGAEWSKGDNKYADMYDLWFHNNFQIIEVTNEDLPEDSGSLLVIGDSYSNNLTRVFVRSFKHVYDVDPRNYKGDLTQYIADKNPDCVAIIMCVESLDAMGK